MLRRARDALFAASLAAGACCAGAVPIGVYHDGFNSGWNGAAYALGSGRFNFSSSWVRDGSTC